MPLAICTPPKPSSAGPDKATLRRTWVWRLLLGWLMIGLLGATVWVTVPTAVAATSSTGVSVARGGVVWVSNGPSFVNGFGLATVVIPPASAWPFRASLQFRGGSGQDSYRGAVLVNASGAARIELSRINSNKETLLNHTVLPGTVSTGQRLNFQAWITGTSPVVVRARFWLDTRPKPDWLVSYNDSTPNRLVSGASVAKVGIFAYSNTISTSVTMDGYAQAASTTQPTNPVASPAPIVSGKRLTAAQVGVPAGTNLTRHEGDITVTQPGTVLSDLDIHGYVIVRAPNVRIVRSIVRGGPAKPYHMGLITSVDQRGLVVEDSLVTADTPSVKNDAVLGNNFTLRRVHVVGGVDSVKIEGDNVRVETSLLEGLNNFASDPSQGGAPSHSDNIQILKGRNIVITGTTAIATDNFPVLAGAEQGPITVTVTNNYVDWGHCNMKFQVRNGWSMSATVQNNTFGPHRTEKSCPFVAENAVNLNAANNRFEDGSAVPIKRI